MKDTTKFGKQPMFNPDGTINVTGLREQQKASRLKEPRKTKRKSVSGRKLKQIHYDVAKLLIVEYKRVGKTKDNLINDIRKYPGHSWTIVDYVENNWKRIKSVDRIPQHRAEKLYAVVRGYELKKFLTNI